MVHVYKKSNRALVLAVSVCFTTAGVCSDERWAGIQNYENTFLTLCNDRGIFAELTRAKPSMDCQKDRWFHTMVIEALDKPYTLDLIEDRLFRSRSDLVYRSTLLPMTGFNQSPKDFNLQQIENKRSGQPKKVELPTLKSYKSISE